MTCYLPKQLLSKMVVFSLSVLILSGCFQTDTSKKITFQPMYENTSLSCQASFLHDVKIVAEPSNQKKWQYQQLQFFLHDIEVKTKKGGWQPWLMTTNSYQANNVVLLGEVCSEKNKQSHWQVELAPIAEAEEVTELRFTLGVPFSLNHLNPLTQPSPLNVSSMFWGWQGGHKFMRVELISQNDDWLFHLGSTGCKALSPVRAPKNECLQPNRVLVTLPFSRDTTEINLDLAVLFRDLTLTRENSCQSAVADESCKVLFENIGLSNKKSSEQLLFKAQMND